MNRDKTKKLICEKCGIEYEQYEVGKYIPELNGDDYCKICRDFLKTKLKSSKKKITKVPIYLSYYPTPNFEPSPVGHGYVRKKKRGDHNHKA